MTVTVHYNRLPTEVATRRLEGVKDFDILGQAFLRFQSLKGDTVFVVPVGRVAALEYEDNTIALS